MPAFSVLIPAYNHARFLPEAIDSVLAQTCQDFEIVVVDDASTDDTAEVMQRFPDPRIRYVVHPHNKGLAATRNTGIRAATGEYLAFLDADDLFAKQKLELHLGFLQQHLELGVTYNARFDLNHSANTIRDIWRPPLRVGLSDFALGYPFAPSDMVIRHEWPVRMGLLNEKHTFYGEDLDFYCQLALSGCRFGSVNRALNFRRYHSGRKTKDIARFREVCFSTLAQVFADPRCPPEMPALRDLAYAVKDLLLGLIALTQDETQLGRTFLQEAVRLNQSLGAPRDSQVLEALINQSVADEAVDHCVLLKKVMDQLPDELRWLSDHYTEAAARGYMLKGFRALIWSRPEAGQRWLQEAARLNARLDQRGLENLAVRLLDYDIEFGATSTEGIIRRLSPEIVRLGGQAGLKWLIGYYSINRAFNSYRNEVYGDVPRQVFRAMFNHPAYLQNRGALKILLKATIEQARVTSFGRLRGLAGAHH